MQQKTLRKTVTAKIDKAGLDSTFKSADSPKTLKEKLKLAQILLEIPANFSDEISVIFQEDTIVFKWHPPKIDKKAEMLHKNALLLARKGNLDDAIKQWDQAALINPSDPDYFFNLGVAFFEQKKYQESIENLTRALAICPFYTKAHLILGTAYLKIRKFEFAKKHITKSIKYNRTNAVAFLNLGAVNSILKQYEEGILMFQKAIELASKEPRAYLGLAKIYSTQGDNEKANYYFKKVIELDTKGGLANYAKRSIVTQKQKSAETDDTELDISDGNPEEFYSQGYRFYISGNYIKSEQMYKKYLALKPKDDYVWFALGETQLRSGKPEIALNSFKEAIKLNSKKGLYFKEIAIVFDKLNKPEKVIAATTKAKELGKTDSTIFCLWGKALYQLRKFDEAISMLEDSVKSNRNNFLAKYYLAKTLIKNNDPDEAVDYLEELKELKINIPLKDKAKVLFEKITEDT